MPARSLLGRFELQGERGEFREGLVELLELIERGSGVGPLARSDGVSRCLEAPFDPALARALLESRIPLHRDEGAFLAAAAQLGRAELRYWHTARLCKMSSGTLRALLFDSCPGIPE